MNPLNNNEMLVAALILVSVLLILLSILRKVDKNFEYQHRYRSRMNVEHLEWAWRTPILKTRIHGVRSQIIKPTPGQKGCWSFMGFVE